MTTTAAGVVQSVDWLAVAPPVLAAVTGLLVLVTDLFLDERRKPLLGGIAVGGLALALAALLPLTGGERATFCLTTDPQACSYTADRFTLAMQLLVLGGALVVALFSTATLREDPLPAGEYWFLLLSSAAGAALLPAARDLATLVIALEVASLPSFALVALRRGDRRGSEAALTFFLSSVAATAVTLLGVSFVYAATGGLHLNTVAEGLADLDTTRPELATLATTGVVLTVVGFAFKAAVAPFHFWVPDTYAGAPVPVAGYLSVIGKAVGFGGLALLTVQAFPSRTDVLGPALAVLAALTMTVGNVAALRQRPEADRGAVRLLAWSSVGQAGYLIVPIAAAAGSDAPDRAIGATLAYALMYATVNLGAFAVVVHVGRSATAHRITDHRGLYARRPLLALALAFFLLCLAGLPPGVVGLFAKVTVFAAAVDAGLGWLAAVMAVNVVIALVYYLRWTALLFRTPAPAAAAVPAPAAAGASAAGEPQAGSDTGSGPDRGPSPAPESSPAPALVGARVGAEEPQVPMDVPLAVAVALTATLAVALSAAPQLILRLTDLPLF